MSYLIISASLSTFSSTMRKSQFLSSSSNWTLVVIKIVVYKFTFPSAFLEKHKTFPEFLLQPLFDVFMQEFFNINVSLNYRFCIKSTLLGNCWKLSIFNQSVVHMLYQFIEESFVWIYFFLIDITLFSCYIPLARVVMV